jgi:hypothetical protein
MDAGGTDFNTSPLRAEEQLRHRMDQHPEQSANQGAVDADVRQIVAHAFLDPIRQGLGIPGLDVSVTSPATSCLRASTNSSTVLRAHVLKLPFGPASP